MSLRLFFLLFTGLLLSGVKGVETLHGWLTGFALLLIFFSLKNKHYFLSGTFLLLSWFLLSVDLGNFMLRETLNNPIEIDDKSLLTISGTVATTPRIQFGNSYFIFNAEKLSHENQEINLKENFYTYVNKFPEGKILKGQKLQCTGRLIPLREDHSFDQYLKFQGVSLKFKVLREQCIPIPDSSSHFFYQLRKHWLSILENTHISRDNLHILNGILLGETCEISKEIKRSFMVNSVYHIFSVSGFHIKRMY